jgi:predicted acetyltransferase
VKLEIVPAERAPLESLLQLYVYDLSALMALDVGEDGRFRTPPIDPWFGDPRCHPFVVRADGKLAGFALIQQRSRLTGDESITDMAEFFILRKFRGRKIGERVATLSFERFAGPWEVRQRSANQPATEFWRRVIGRYTGGRFSDELLDDERWRGPVQRFDSRK